MKELKNYGLIRPVIQPEEWVLGASGNPSATILEPDGDWRDHLPEREIQHNKNFDTSNCFPYSTKILMEDLSFKNINEVKIGDYVITHRGNIKRVLKTFKRRYNENFTELSIRGFCDKFYCTPNHPILTQDGWKIAGEIKRDDMVYLPTTSNLKKDATIYSVEKNIDFLWLLGFYIAEGSVIDAPKREKNNNPKLKVNGSGSGNGRVCFSISEDEINTYGERVSKILKTLFDTNVVFSKNKNSKSIVLNLYNFYLRTLLEELGGRYSYGKKLSSRMMLLEPELQLYILRGWLDGDGYKNDSARKKRMVQGVSVSYELIKQMFLICLRNNIKATIQKSYKAEGKRQAYTLNIYGTGINKVYDWNLEDITKAPSRDKFINDSLTRKVQKVKRTKLRNLNVVYNLSIEDDESFIADFISVHNCTAFGLLNGVECLMRRKFGLFINYSDRALGIVSGTYPPGNSPNVVAEYARKFGFIPEVMLPLNDTLTSVSEYYSPKPLPNDLFNEGQKWLKKYTFKHWWIGNNYSVLSTAKLKEALKYSPVGVAVLAWFKNDKGEYYVPPEYKNQENHWTLLVYIDEDERKYVYDSYDDTIKILEKGYPIVLAKGYAVEVNLSEEQTNYFMALINKIKDAIAGLMGRLGSLTLAQSLLDRIITLFNSLYPQIKIGKKK